MTGTVILWHNSVFTKRKPGYWRGNVKQPDWIHCSWSILQKVVLFNTDVTVILKVIGSDKPFMKVWINAQGMLVQVMDDDKTSFLGWGNHSRALAIDRNHIHHCTVVHACRENFEQLFRSCNIPSTVQYAILHCKGAIDSWA